MAEGETFSVGNVGDNVDDDSFEFQVGVGRGLFRQPLDIRTPGPNLEALDTPVLTSTRCLGHAVPGQDKQNDQTPDLGSLIAQLAEKIGQSISEKLQSDRSTQLSDSPQQSMDMTLSNVKLVVQSDAKERPIYRGHGSDKFTVHEWEELIKLYLKKRAIPFTGGYC